MMTHRAPTVMHGASPCPFTQTPQNVPQSIYRRAAQHLEEGIASQRKLCF